MADPAGGVPRGPRHSQAHRTYLDAKNLANLHIVIHGADLPDDTDAGSLSSLFEATLPVACGEIDKPTR